MAFYNFVKKQIDKFTVAILDDKSECNIALQFFVITKTKNPTITYQQTHKGNFTSDKRLAIQSNISNFIQKINAETITNSEQNGLDFYVQEFTNEVYKDLIKELHVEGETVVSSILTIGSSAVATLYCNCPQTENCCPTGCCIALTRDIVDGKGENSFI
jgi:hypothetical protein